MAEISPQTITALDEFLAAAGPWREYVMQVHTMLNDKADQLLERVARLEASTPAAPAATAPVVALPSRPAPVFEAGRTSVGVGVTTYNRPDYARQSLRALIEQVGSLATLYVYDDGSAPQHAAAYRRLFEEVAAQGVQVIAAPQNSGVAVAKNALTQRMLADGHDWIFLCEDDIIVTSPQAVSGYIEACVGSGSHHLSFAHHGPANAAGAVKWDGRLAWYEHSIGAWAVFTRTCLEGVGFFDTRFRNAWEHVEHELRLIGDGWCPGAQVWCFADARGSEAWITEIPGSLDNSSIRVDPEWGGYLQRGAEHWAATRPDTFAMIFGPGREAQVAQFGQWRSQSLGAWGPIDQVTPR